MLGETVLHPRLKHLFCLIKLCLNRRIVTERGIHSFRTTRLKENWQVFRWSFNVFKGLNCFFVLLNYITTYRTANRRHYLYTSKLHKRIIFLKIRLNYTRILGFFCSAIFKTKDYMFVIKKIGLHFAAKNIGPWCTILILCSSH